jgi:hypothetical protein
LRAGHALQTSRATGKHAHKVGRDGVVESGDAVGEKPGDGSGESVSSERTEERLERLPDHERERSRRVLHGGVPRMSWHIIKKNAPPSNRFAPSTRRNQCKLTVENGSEHPDPSRGHPPVLHALPVLGSELVHLAWLEVYRVSTARRRRGIRESLKFRGQTGLLKDSVGPAFGPSQAHIRRGKVSDLIEGPEIFYGCGSCQRHHPVCVHGWVS